MAARSRRGTVGPCVVPGRTEEMTTEWGALAEIAAAARTIRYPDGIEPVSVEIPGPAFFPGGRGLVTSDQRVADELPRGGVLVLGHNYGTVADHTRYVRSRGEVEGNVTWRRLRRLLEEAGIGLQECFFTNAFVGLLKTDSNRGSQPGHRDPAFLADCRALFVRQLHLQRPRLLLALGRFVPNFLASLSPQLGAWSGMSRFSAVDAAGPVRAAFFDGHPVVVAALVHPCHRHITAACRSYGGDRGHMAELAMVRDGRAAAGHS